MAFFFYSLQRNKRTDVIEFQCISLGNFILVTFWRLFKKVRDGWRHILNYLTLFGILIFVFVIGYFSKFYGKLGVISMSLFHLIWKNYVLYWDFDLKSWIVDFFTHFTREKTPQNNFSRQNFSVENNYFFLFLIQFLWNLVKLYG